MTEDERLLEQWKRQGSQAAFSALVTRHLDFVYSVCLRETQDAALAEDVTQVVFLLLSRKAPSFSPNTWLTGWLFQTARFACKNALRRDSSRRRREQKVGEQMLTEAQGQDALWEQVAPHLNAGLASLGAKDREAVLLRFADGLSFSELGTALGTSEDAARMRVSRALTRLRGFFAKQGIPVTALVLTDLLADRTTQAAPVTCTAAVQKIGTHGGVAPLSPDVYTQLQGALNTMKLNQLKLAATLGTGAFLVATLPFVTQARTQKNAVASRPVQPAVRSAVDRSGVAVLTQAAQATAALHSLSADVEGGGQLMFQRPDKFRFDLPGGNSQTGISNGTDFWFYMHWNKEYQKETNPDLKVDTLGLPVFSTFFFNPGLQGLVLFSIKPPADTSVRLLGTRQWHGGIYTAIEIIYPAPPPGQNDPISGTLTAYFGADHLLHGYSAKMLYRGKTSVQESALKNLRINPDLAAEAFLFTPPAGSRPSQPPVAHMR